MLTMLRPLPTKGTEVAPSFTDFEIVLCFWFPLKFSFEGELIMGPVCELTAPTALLRFECCWNEDCLSEW